MSFICKLPIILLTGLIVYWHYYHAEEIGLFGLSSTQKIWQNTVPCSEVECGEMCWGDYIIFSIFRNPREHCERCCYSYDPGVYYSGQFFDIAIEFDNSIHKNIR